MGKVVDARDEPGHDGKTESGVQHRHARRMPGIHDFLDPADAGAMTASAIRQPNLAAGAFHIHRFKQRMAAWLRPMRDLYPG